MLISHFVFSSTIYIRILIVILYTEKKKSISNLFKKLLSFVKRQIIKEKIYSVIKLRLELLWLRLLSKILFSLFGSVKFPPYIQPVTPNPRTQLHKFCNFSISRMLNFKAARV